MTAQQPRRSIGPVRIVLVVALVAAVVGGLYYAHDLYGLWQFKQAVDNDTRIAAREGIEARGLAEVCANCHGLDGNGKSQYYPHLAGLPAAYIRSQLDAFAAGTRHEPQMEPLSLDVTGKQKQLLSDYFARQVAAANDGFRPDPAKSARGRALSGTCATCHGAGLQGGTVAIRMAGNDTLRVSTPRLAGQARDYLARQLRAFRKGTRIDPTGAMQAAARGLSDTDVDSLSAYLASR